MIYYEQMHFDGRWMPRTSAEAPRTRTVNGELRISTAGDDGPRVRAITEVPEDMEKLTLDSKREVFSPDGKFRTVHRQGWT